MSTAVANEVFFRPVQKFQMVRYKRDPSGDESTWGLMVVSREPRGGMINGVEVNTSGQRARVLEDLVHIDDPQLKDPAVLELITSDDSRGVWDYLPHDHVRSVGALNERLIIAESRIAALESLIESLSATGKATMKGKPALAVPPSITKPE